MTVVRELLISFGAKLDKGSVKKVEKQTKGLAGTIQKVLSGAFLLALGKGVFSLNEMASDVEENLNVINQSFGDSAQSVREWAQTFGDAAGRNRFELEETAATLGAVLNPLMEENTEIAADMSTNLAALTVDLGSFFNAVDKDVLVALRSGITGEAEPLKRFGIIMNEATLKAFALSSGIKGNVKNMSIAEKTALRYNFILNQTKNAQGDAERTALGWANAKKAALGKIKEVATAVGMKLLPIMSRLAVGARTVVTGFMDFVRGTRLLEAALIVLGAIAAKVAIGMLTAFAPVIVPMLKLAAVVAFLALLVDDFLVFLDKGDSIIGRFIDSMFGPGSAAEAVDKLKEAWQLLKIVWIQDILPALKTLRKKIGEFFGWIKPHVEDLLSILGKGVKRLMVLWDRFFNFMIDEGGPAFEVFKEKAKSAVDSVHEWFKNLFDDIGDWVISNQKHLEAFAEAVRAVSRAISRLFGIDNDLLKSGLKRRPSKGSGGPGAPGDEGPPGSAGALGGSAGGAVSVTQRLFVPASSGAPVTNNIQNSSTVNVEGNASVETAERIGRVSETAIGRSARRTLAALTQKKRKD